MEHTGKIVTIDGIVTYDPNTMTMDFVPVDLLGHREDLNLRDRQVREVRIIQTGPLSYRAEVIIESASMLSGLVSRLETLRGHCEQA